MVWLVNVLKRGVDEWDSDFFLGMERIGEIVRSRVFVFWFCCGLFGMIEVFFFFYEM